MGISHPDAGKMRGHSADIAPRVVINDVHVRTDHETGRVHAGTVVRTPPGSAYERELGGAANLRPLQHSDRDAGVTN